MKILKRVLCILFAVLVLSMPVIRTYQAHAEAIAASTIAAYAVLGTALAACGIMVAAANSGTSIPVADALGAAWDMTTAGIKSDINNICLTVGLAGGLVAHWTADKWHRFTNWVKETFPLGAENAIPIAAASIAFADACLVNASLDTIPRIELISGRNLSSFSYELNSSRQSYLKLDWNSSGYIYAYLVAGASNLFWSATSAAIYREMHAGFQSISVFQPVITDTLNIHVATRYQSDVTSLTESSLVHVGLSGWRFGYDCGNPAYIGQTIINDHGTLKIGNTGVAIRGTWNSIADYIGACIDAGVVIGIPLPDGSVSSQDDVVNPAMDELPVSIDADYYPDTGASAADTDLPDGIGYDVYIPTATEYTGPDVFVKDVTDGDIDFDLDRVGDQTASDARPRVRADPDAATTVANPYMTTAKSIDIPSDIADQTIAHPPSGGGDGEEGDDDDGDGNKLKLPGVMLTKFPFCIPHDFKVAVEQLIADPQPPKFNFHLKIDSLHLDYTIPVDFSSFESVAYFVRWLLAAFWVIILIRGTARLLDT